MYEIKPTQIKQSLIADLVQWLWPDEVQFVCSGTRHSQIDTLCQTFFL